MKVKLKFDHMTTHCTSSLAGKNKAKCARVNVFQLDMLCVLVSRIGRNVASALDAHVKFKAAFTACNGNKLALVLGIGCVAPYDVTHVRHTV